MTQKVVNTCIKIPYIWRSFTKFQLKTNMRLSEGTGDYSQFQLDIGEDKIPINENEEIILPKEMNV